MSSLSTVPWSPGGPRAQRPLGESVLIYLLFGSIYPPTCADLSSGSGPGSSRDWQPRAPQAWLPQQHLFVRHQHLKMSDCFQRVRSGSLPSLPFSFFNSSCLCPSCKLPLSPWGWRRAVSLFPSQTSVSINSCSGHLLLLGPGFGEEVLCLSGGGRFPCSSGAGRCGMAVAVDSRSPRPVASDCCSSGVSVCWKGLAALHSCLVDPGSALLAGLPSTGYLSSLSLCFLLCKVRKLTVPP